MENVALFSAELIKKKSFHSYSAYTDHNYSIELTSMDPETRFFKTNLGNCMQKNRKIFAIYAFFRSELFLKKDFVLGELLDQLVQAPN